MLNKCAYCNSLFTSVQREWMMCSKAKIFIDFHGGVIAQHVTDRNFNINKFVMFLRQKSIPWKTIYWKLWSRMIQFDCISCERKFVGAEIEHCSFHPLKPKFAYGLNDGM
jgi:hypothetical protein